MTPTLGATWIPASSPTVGPTASAAPALAFRTWTRTDLADPAPGIYGGSGVSGLVAFQGGYVATGSVSASCCAGGDPSLNWGVVWTSTDGRTWQLHNHLASLDHATLHALLTAGTSLYLFGDFAPTPGSEAAGSPTVWVSTDALHWTRSTGLAPTVAAIGPHGLVGALALPNVSGDTVSFVRSTDGLHWAATSPTYEADLAGLAVGPDGDAIALGSVPGTPFPDGTRTFDTVAWRSVDGTSWTGPVTIAADVEPKAVAAAGDGFLVIVWRNVELPTGSVVNPSEIWRLVGTSSPSVTAVPMIAEDALRSIFVSGSTVLLIGDTLVNGMTNAMVWVSTDAGATFGRVAEQSGFSGINNEVAAIVPNATGLIAGGHRFDSATTHPLPVVWLATR